MAADESRAVNVCPLSRSAASNSCSRYCAGLFIDSSFLRLFFLGLVLPFQAYGGGRNPFQPFDRWRFCR
nr:MAG TPA_asm: hypothetical protein [Caudoviricetes sp.]